MAKSRTKKKGLAFGALLAIIAGVLLIVTYFIPALSVTLNIAIATKTQGVSFLNYTVAMFTNTETATNIVNAIKDAVNSEDGGAVLAGLFSAMEDTTMVSKIVGYTGFGAIILAGLEVLLGAITAFTKVKATPILKVVCLATALVMIVNFICVIVLNTKLNEVAGLGEVLKYALSVGSFVGLAGGLVSIIPAFVKR